MECIFTDLMIFVKQTQPLHYFVLVVQSIFNKLNIDFGRKNNMDQYNDQTEIYKALSHPTRLAILNLLRDGDECVCHMEACLGLRQAYISQHLMVLRNAGLITNSRSGLNRYYTLNNDRILEIIDLVSQLRSTNTQKIYSSPRSQCSCPKCQEQQLSTSYPASQQQRNLSS